MTRHASQADKLTETVERLREALGKAAFQFETYERGHRAKAGTLAMTVGAHHGDTFAAIEKADRNAAMVRMCRDAIDGAALTPAGEDERDRLCRLIEQHCPSRGEHGHPIGSEVERLADVILAALSRPNVDDILAGIGWVYSNDGADEEYAPDHPVESGEVPGATNIRRSTQMEDALNDHVQCLFQATLSRPNVDEMREALSDLEQRATAALSAMDRYNEKNGTHIIGPSLLQLGKSIAHARAALNGSGNHG